MKKIKFRKIKNIIILLLIICAAGVPLFIQFVVFRNNLVTGASKDGWAGFFGSYLGAIIGALTTLAALSIEIQHSEASRKREEILNIRPYLYLKVNESTESGTKTRIKGEIRNIGLHSACDVYIYESGNHPDASGTWTRHNAISINGAEEIDKEFDLAKTVNYKFTYYDLKSNMYEQEFHYDAPSQSFYSLEPKLIKLSNID